MGWDGMVRGWAGRRVGEEEGENLGWNSYNRSGYGK